MPHFTGSSTEAQFMFYTISKQGTALSRVWTSEALLNMKRLRKRQKREKERKEGGLFRSFFMECQKGFHNPQINPDLLVTVREVRGA